MGKAGYKAVKEFFRINRVDYGRTEERAKYVADSLRDLRFIYKFPEQTVRQWSFCNVMLKLMVI